MKWKERIQKYQILKEMFPSWLIISLKETYSKLWFAFKFYIFDILIQLDACFTQNINDLQAKSENKKCWFDTSTFKILRMVTYYTTFILNILKMSKKNNVSIEGSLFFQYISSEDFKNIALQRADLSNVVFQNEWKFVKYVVFE